MSYNAKKTPIWLDDKLQYLPQRLKIDICFEIFWSAGGSPAKGTYYSHFATECISSFFLNTVGGGTRLCGRRTDTRAGWRWNIWGERLQEEEGELDPLTFPRN